MLYERMGLVMPRRQGHQRRYTDDDLRWLHCIREINHEGGVSLAGMRAFLRYLPCWALRSVPRALQNVSPGRFDPGAAAAAIEELLRGCAPECCEGCGYYRATDNESVHVRDRRGN